MFLFRGIIPAVASCVPADPYFVSCLSDILQKLTSVFEAVAHLHFFFLILRLDTSFITESDALGRLFFSLFMFPVNDRVTVT